MFYQKTKAVSLISISCLLLTGSGLVAWGSAPKKPTKAETKKDHKMWVSYYSVGNKETKEK